MRNLLLCLWLVFGAARPAALALEVFHVRDFGAKGDGQTLDTEAINNAIEAATVKAGSQVHFAPGRYLTGTLVLQSELTIFLEPGAVLVGSTNLADYKAFRPPPGTPEAGFKPDWHRALLLGDKVENVTLTGGGTIDGNKVFDPQGEEHRRGPHTILIGHGRNITLQNLTLRDSANYAILLEDCSDVQMTALHITGGWDGVHFRGWPDSYCRNVKITDCQLFTGDDAIAGRYWENVIITDCVINSSCNGIRLIGPAKKLMVNDCQFFGPGQFAHRSSGRTNMLAAVALQPGAWDPTEGLLDDVHLSDLAMQNVMTPFHFAMKGRNTAGRIEVSKVKAAGVYQSPSTIESWSDNVFTNVTFRDVEIEFVGGGGAADARIAVNSPGVDARKMPVWGFYGRNVENLILQNVQLKLGRSDLRAVARFDHVAHLTLDHFDYPRSRDVTQPILKESVGEVVER